MHIDNDSDGVFARRRRDIRALIYLSKHRSHSAAAPSVSATAQWWPFDWDAKTSRG